MTHRILLLAALLIIPASQTTAQTAVPKKMEPADPGMHHKPPRVENTPADPGAIVTPPRTGTEEIIKTPNKAVDPKIDDATTDIDRRNRERTEKKTAR